MTIRTAVQRQALANSYGTAAPNGALFTADPGTGGAATGEVTGGTPAYARKTCDWAAATDDGTSASITSGTPPTFDVPASTTVTFFGVTVSVTAGTADVRDSVGITSQNFASQGTYQVTPTYSQS